MCTDQDTLQESGEILLSIIIPVYNVEPYLEQCLLSVLQCNLEACEVLLSLGRSADRSNSICADFERDYPMIQTLYQKGTGLSDARNSAMEIARGKYVLFIDSDDFVDSDCLNSVIGHLRSQSLSADVIVTDFYRLDRRTGQIIGVFQIGADRPVWYGMDFLPTMLHKRQCFWNVWRYIYRRDFLREQGIRFWENKLSEDVDYTTSVFVANPEIVFTHSPYYVYGVGRGDSIMDRPDLKRLTDTVFILKNSIGRLRMSDFRYASLMIAQFQFEYLLNLALVVEIDPKDQAEAAALYRDWKTVLVGSSDPVVSFAALVVRLIGIRAMSCGLHHLKLIRRWVRCHTKKRRALT